MILWCSGHESLCQKVLNYYYIIENKHKHSFTAIICGTADIKKNLKNYSLAL